MDLRHVDHQRFYTWAAPCCFKAPVRREGQRIVTRFQLQEVRALAKLQQDVISEECQAMTRRMHACLMLSLHACWAKADRTSVSVPFGY